MIVKTLIALAVYIAVPFLAFAADPVERRPLAFGVFPRWNAQITVRDFTPLARILGHELGREVRIETDKDFDSFMRRVIAGEFDLVHLNQLQYVYANRKAGYRAIVKMCENSACTIKAAIVARRDSGFRKIMDLRGKTVAFGDPNAMVSHVLARSLLQESTLKRSQYHTIFTKNPPNALLAVYNGTADAAGIGLSVLQRPEILERVDVGQLQILAESKPIPHLPIAVRKDMEVSLIQNIRRVLIKLGQEPEGGQVLARIGIMRFETTDDAQYASFRELIEEEADVAP